jgi:hypothetical protein
MKKVNEKLTEIFDVEPVDLTKKPDPVNLPVATTGDVVDDDAEFARNNIKELIVKGNKAMDELLLVANASEHPRAYEVAAGLIKNLSDLNKDLLELQKRKKDLKSEGPARKSDLNIDKAVVFSGSTTDLIRMLKGK